jgi:N6-adenosine-specific RNA methylase IME4
MPHWHDSNPWREPVRRGAGIRTAASAGIHRSTNTPMRESPLALSCTMAPAFGNPKRHAKDVHEIIIAPVREHSRKPDRRWCGNLPFSAS